MERDRSTRHRACTIRHASPTKHHGDRENYVHHSLLNILRANCPFVGQEKKEKAHNGIITLWLGLGLLSKLAEKSGPGNVTRTTRPHSRRPTTTP